MSPYKPLPSNATIQPTLFLKEDAPVSDLLANAMRRIEATRDLASALSVAGHYAKGVGGRDLAAFGLVVEILTSDAAALMDAIEGAQIRSERGAP